MLPPKLEKLRRTYGFGRDRGFIFFPILLGQLTEYHPYYNFWKKESPLYYPLLLVSYGMLDGDYYDVRRAYRLDEDIFLLTDSGAFQLFSSGRDVSQAEVLTWQLRHSNAGIILDHIPAEPGTGRSSPEIFERSLELTRKNVEYIIRNFDKLKDEYAFDRNFKMMAVLHGASPDQVKRWEEQIIRPLFETDIAYCVGFSVAVVRHPEKHKVVLYRLGQLLDYKCVHTLGTSSRKIVALLTYITDRYDVILQADSSALLAMIKTGNIYWPSSLRASRRKPIGNKATEHHYWCPCPYCQRFYRDWGTFPWEVESFRKEPRSALFAHTYFYQFVEIQAVVADVVSEPEQTLGYYGIDIAEIEEAFSDWESYYSKAYEVFPGFFKEMASYVPRKARGWW